MFYFAYGSNLNFEQMKYRCPKAKFVTKAILPDHKLTFRGGGYATVEPAPGEQVEGAIWSISKECLHSLDCYEGYPTFYFKQDIEVVLPDRQEITAMVYIMNTGYAFEPPTSYYYKTVAQGYSDCKLNLANLNKVVKKAIVLAEEQQLNPNYSHLKRRKPRASNG